MIHMKNLKKVKIWCESTGVTGVSDEPTKNPVTSSEEPGHEELVIQGEQAETPGPSSVQHIPLSTCNNSTFSCKMDDPAPHEPMDSPVCSEEAAIETSICDREQLLIKGPVGDSPVQMRQEDSCVQSRTTDVLCSTSDDSGLRGERADMIVSEAFPVALEESTYKNGIQGWLVEEPLLSFSV
ncbi:hypothetical protein EJB05_33793, partial [Eragrostis curvula]